MSGLGRYPDLRNPDLGGSTVVPKFTQVVNDRNDRPDAYECNIPSQICHDQWSLHAIDHPSSLCSY